MIIKYLKFVSIWLLIISSAIMAFYDISGWGWFLFATILAIPYVM